MKRKIAVITGSRSEYGLLGPVLRKIEDEPGLRLQLMVTGMHLSRAHGHTIDLIRRDGFAITAAVEGRAGGNSGADMALSTAAITAGLAGAYQKHQPDLVLILGDRTEVLAAAVAALYMNIPVAHIHGGDVGAGCVDNSVRDAVTKLAQLHFAASRKSYERILRLGEEKWRVFNAGSPGLDSILQEKPVGKIELFRKYRLDPAQPLLLLLQHPVTTEIAAAGRQMAESLKAVKAAGLPTVVIYPNSEAGNVSIRKEIDKRRGDDSFRIIENLAHVEYLSFLRYAAVLVGNSSSGIIEAPSFNLPVVNVGLRQQGRERGGNVIDVPHDAARIGRAIKRALTDTAFRKKLARCRSPYGDGRASARIVKVLARVGLGQRLLQKQIL